MYIHVHDLYACSTVMKTVSFGWTIIMYNFYSQLLESTCRIANVFKREGVKKGDRVALYMPASPLLAASMLACARIGAIHR